MITVFDILKKLISFFKFHSIRIGKWFYILFKKNRKLKKISFDYYKNWHSKSSFLVVNFKFGNAIYFKVGDIKSYNFSIPLILNLQNIKTNNIEVEVFGFSQKQVFVIELNKEIQLNTKLFRTTIENSSIVEIPRQKTKIKIVNLLFFGGQPKVAIQNFSINVSDISIKFKNFKTQEFI